MPRDAAESPQFCFLLHPRAFKLDPATLIFPWQDFRAKTRGIYSEARPLADTNPTPSVPWPLASQVSIDISLELIRGPTEETREVDGCLITAAAVALLGGDCHVHLHGVLAPSEAR